MWEPNLSRSRKRGLIAEEGVIKKGVIIQRTVWIQKKHDQRKRINDQELLDQVLIPTIPHFQIIKLDCFKESRNKKSSDYAQTNTIEIIQ